MRAKVSKYEFNPVRNQIELQSNLWDKISTNRTNEGETKNRKRSCVCLVCLILTSLFYLV